MYNKKLSNKIILNKKEIISNNKKCFIVAEISGNHGGSLNIMIKSIKKAKEIGADAVRLTFFKSSSLLLTKALISSNGI